MSSLNEKQKAALNSDLDASAIATRKGGGNRDLSYLEGWYVIDRLNAILGSGEWGYNCHAICVVAKTVVGKDGKERFAVTYNSKCDLEVGSNLIGDWGTGHGLDPDEGQAHESAIKEACTDALKRCAKSLGRSMGLALYDKKQSHVEAPGHAAAKEAVEALGQAGDAAALAVAKSLAKSAWGGSSKDQREELALAVKVAEERVSIMEKEASK